MGVERTRAAAPLADVRDLPVSVRERNIEKGRAGLGDRTRAYAPKFVRTCTLATTPLLRIVTDYTFNAS